MNPLSYCRLLSLIACDARVHVCACVFVCVRVLEVEIIHDGRLHP